MNICSLNNDKTYCVDDKKIIKLHTKVTQDNNKIKNNSISGSNKIDTDAIIEELAEITECSNDLDGPEKGLCILKTLKKDSDEEVSKTATKLLFNEFKPPTGSFDKNYWLNNTEIDHIQHQLFRAFPGYYYSNIHMIDLVMIDPKHTDQLKYTVHPITEIDFVEELKTSMKLTDNGPLKYYGVVCNTDHSANSGIHWFSIFIDFTSSPYTIEYFNSSGYDIKNKNFHNFLNNLADDIDCKHKNCEFVKVTDIQHQQSSTANCGSYSLYYIWMRLNGTKFDHFAKNKIMDEDMEKFRQFLYRLK
jgi:hypothetical protein